MKVIVVFLLCIVATLAAPEERWVNDYDQPFYYSCPGHQSISMIISIHDNGREDRVWDFSCKDTFSSPASCFWTGYINEFDQEFNYVCPFGSVLAGLGGYHDNKREDRRWEAYCCQGEVRVTSNCKWSGYVNDFDQYLRWDAPSGFYLTGVQSYHDNHREDRRWQYHYCEKDA
ncbi:hemagglutinin/amebocyte aggregation factor-like [Gastrophryne carolinensis]